MFILIQKRNKLIHKHIKSRVNVEQGYFINSNAKYIQNSD